MAKKRSLLDQMRDHPRGDWSIGDIERLCREHRLDLMKPTGGSHYKISCREIAYILTVPAHRPIKPVYIRELVSFVDYVASGRVSAKERKDD